MTEKKYDRYRKSLYQYLAFVFQTLRPLEQFRGFAQGVEKRELGT